MAFEYFFRNLVCVRYEFSNLIINLRGYMFGIILFGRYFPAEEDKVFLSGQGVKGVLILGISALNPDKAEAFISACAGWKSHVNSVLELLDGELGEILTVDGHYAQDWLLYDTDFNWRILRKDNGPLRVVGDIGSHWMDMIQHITGLPITAVCADLEIFHKVRKQPKVAIETFAGTKLRPEDYKEIKIDTEDYGALLIHLGDRARGTFMVSQMAAGCKNRFEFMICGTKASVSWNQEQPNSIWVGYRNEPNRIIQKDPSLMDPKAAPYSSYPGGHAEGYPDAHKNLFKAFWSRVADPSLPIEYPTFADGLRGMLLLEKVIESDKKRGWVNTGLSVKKPAKKAAK